MKRKAKKRKNKKNGGKHASSPKTAKHLTHTKAPQATQSTEAIQTYIQQGKPSKNPLKTRNRAIFASNAPRAKQESRRKAGNTPPEDQSQPPAGPEAPKSLTTCTSGHAKRQASRPHFQPFPSLTFKNMLVFCPFLSPKIPRKHQRPPKKI